MLGYLNAWMHICLKLCCFLADWINELLPKKVGGKELAGLKKVYWKLKSNNSVLWHMLYIAMVPATQFLNYRQSSKS